MGIFGFGDQGFLGKKIREANTGSGYTDNNLKHYGSKATDVFAAVAVIPVVYFLLKSVFGKGNNSQPRNNNNNGKTRKR
jgi:hypothetical protein